MNRRSCTNCQVTWPSLADHELDAPHNCPRCGDELLHLVSAPLEVAPGPVRMPVAQLRELAA